ncbi:hypothetical protein Anas_11844, partial [Armadillidium nasatum]
PDLFFINDINKNMSGVKINEITPSHTLGEGPHWLGQSLIYVDIPEGNLHRYSLSTEKVQTLHFDDGGKSVSFVVPVEGEKDVYAAGVIHVDPKVEKVERIIKFPSLQTTSCSWGGRDYSTLFVTSANFKLNTRRICDISLAQGKCFLLLDLVPKVYLLSILS